jgi:hypothetical protein
MIEQPSSITYSNVVSRDSIRILLVIAALNDLEAWYNVTALQRFQNENLKDELNTGVVSR